MLTRKTLKSAFIGHLKELFGRKVAIILLDHFLIFIVNLFSLFFCNFINYTVVCDIFPIIFSRKNKKFLPILENILLKFFNCIIESKYNTNSGLYTQALIYGQ